jgi:arylsulfatase A-like enzyme/Tfp pilus assembly protein PilF
MKRTAYVIMVLLLTLICYSSFITSNADTPLQKKSIVFITIDTLRADHIGILKEKNIQTPVIDGIARTGILWSHVFTTVPLTLPSHVSIFTGTYPPKHKVRNNGQIFHDSQIQPLAAILKKQGYSTYAITASYVLHSRFGLAQGFDSYSNVQISPEFPIGINTEFIERNASEVLEESKNIIPTIKKPFFLWVHFYDPHAPYNPPAGFKKGTPAESYQGEVEYVDSAIGKLFEYLTAYQLVQDTITVIASDHGEALGEHKEQTHGHFIYQSTLRVPLIIKVPGFAPRVIATPVSTADIAPTLLTVVNIPVPSYMDGNSLLSKGQPIAGSNKRILYAETYQPYLDYHWAPLLAVIKNNKKFIEAPQSELYDLEKDYQESHNILDPADLPSWNKQLTPFISTSMGDSNIDSAAREALSSLGYAGGSTKTSISLSELMKLADPKNRIVELESIHQAMDYLNGGNINKALAILSDIYEQDKGNLRALYLMSQAFKKIGNWDEAINSMKKAAALNSDYLSQYFLLKADYYAKQRNMNEAEKNYLEVIALNPQEFAAYNNLAQITFAKGNKNLAINYLRKAVELAPENLDAKNNLALLLFNQNSLDEAQSLLNSILAVKPEHQYALLNLIKLYIKTEEYDKAYQPVSRLIILYPDNKRYLQLGIDICIKLGKSEEAHNYTLKLEALQK